MTEKRKCKVCGKDTETVCGICMESLCNACAIAHEIGTCCSYKILHICPECNAKYWR
ncbi:MAG: hypothetical protein QMC85_01425 [Methanocellales archaeon]|nr:hypothetical protein [Methanocellales archaeon]MDI6902970.1 hypothetical protein [Methanocellales archaeon]